MVWPWKKPGHIPAEADPEAFFYTPEWDAMLDRLEIDADSPEVIEQTRVMIRLLDRIEALERRVAALSPGEPT